MPCRDNAIYNFSKKAVENGLDIFRVFDSLNYFGMCRDLVDFMPFRKCLSCVMKTWVDINMKKTKTDEAWN